MRPTKHSTTGIYRVRLTIPVPLRDVALRLYGVKRELVENLGTRDPSEAARLAPEAMATLRAKLENIYATHTSQARPLTNREIHALVGAWYQAETKSNEDDPGDGEEWRQFLLDLEGDIFPDQSAEDYKPDAAMLAEAQQLLFKNKILADSLSIGSVAKALWRAKINFAYLMTRRAAGDYSVDPMLAKIPTLHAPAPTTAPPTSIDEAVKGWARDHGHNPEAKPIPRAFYDRQRTAARLAEFLGHNDAGRVTKADAVRWKASMNGKSLATIANDISEMSAVWRWAMANGKAAENPFAGILPPKKARNKKATRRPFTDDEAVKILLAARNEKGALRWLPWVLALTGARVSEVCQGKKDDLIIVSGKPFLRIHDDDEKRAAGEAQRSLKNESSLRTVPVHPKLVAEGFTNYVTQLPSGSALFPDIKPDKKFGNRGNSAQRLVSRWLRGKLKITDKQISPNHSWRHYFIDKARSVGMNPEVRDAITGHIDNRNESSKYGKGFRQMPERLAEEMAKIRLPDEL